MGGCESEDNHNVSITLIHAWGGTEKDHAEMRDIYAEFQKEYPEIDLQIISMPTSEEMMRKVEDMVMFRILSLLVELVKIVCMIF